MTNREVYESQLIHQLLKRNPVRLKKEKQMMKVELMMVVLMEMKNKMKS